MTGKAGQGDGLDGKQAFESVSHLHAGHTSLLYMKSWVLSAGWFRRLIIVRLMSVFPRIIDATVSQHDL